jgi:integrase
MCLGAAVRAHVIRLDPSAGITPPKVVRGGTDMAIPTPGQVRSALDAAPDDFRAFVAVCAFAGLRLGEAAGLQVGDVDFLRRTITVDRQIQGQVNATATEKAPKYESVRTVYVPDGLVATLARHIETVPLLGDDGYLFSQRGYVYNRNSAGKAWRDLRSAVGMGAFTLHDLRHFFASGLIAAGCDVVTVQHALGHSSPSITLNTYSHLWPKAEERTRNAAAALMADVFADDSQDLADSVRTEDA